MRSKETPIVLRTCIKCVLVIISCSLMNSCMYMENRLNDFTDSFVCTCDAGLGVSAYAHPGIFGVGVGGWGGYSFGLERKSYFGVSDEFHIGLPFSLIPYHSMWCGTSWSAVDYNKGAECSYLYNLFIIHAEGTGSWLGYFRIIISARVFVGAKIGFNIAEFADFILGFGNLDIANDDSIDEVEEEADKNKESNPNGESDSENANNLFALENDP